MVGMVECEDTLKSYFKASNNCWVENNRGGPEKVEGILQVFLVNL